MERLEQFVEALEKDDGPSVRETREEIEQDIKDTKNHILALRSRMGDVLKRRFSYTTPDWEGADHYNKLMETSLSNVSDSVNDAAKNFLKGVSDICEMADRMNR